MKGHKLEVIISKMKENLSYENFLIKLAIKWTMIQTDEKKLLVSEMTTFRRIRELRWLDKVSNEEILSKLDA